MGQLIAQYVSNSIQTSNNIILENRYDPVESNRGVMIVDKKTGEIKFLN